LPGQKRSRRAIYGIPEPISETSSTIKRHRTGIESPSSDRFDERSYSTGSSETVLTDDEESNHDVSEEESHLEVPDSQSHVPMSSNSQKGSQVEAMNQILTKHDSGFMESVREYCELYELGYNEMSKSEKKKARKRVYQKFKSGLQPRNMI
jgi:hypothetical protein